MRKLLFLLSLACTVAQAQTGQDIFKQSGEKIKALKSVSYNIYADQYGEKITADVLINRKKPYPIFEISQVKLSGIVMNDEGSKQISFASDGSRLEFIDTKDNSLVQLDSPTVSKLSRTGLMPYMLLALSAYIRQEPYDALYNIMKSATLEGDTSIYNVKCYKVKVVTEFSSAIAAAKQSETNWYFGKDDLLVRGIASAYSKQFLKIKEVNKEYADAQFSLAPQGEVKKMTGREPISNGMLAVGTMAPDWKLPSQDGKNISLRELRGKVVLLDFWGTWCVPCIKAMPEIQAIYDHFKGKNVEVIGVSVETESAADPLGFVKRKGFTYPIALKGHTITAAYKVKEFPGVYIIGKDGKIIHAESGGNRENFKEDIIGRIEKALAN